MICCGLPTKSAFSFLASRSYSERLKDMFLSKTLTQRLKVLEERGFVQRRAFLEIPPRVEYHLTEKGQEFGDVIAAIEQFAQKNLSDLVEAVTAAKPH
jgi:DNA-binding HxlR family transcriptional regulator